MFKNEQLSNMITSNPNKNTILSRIYNEKTRLHPDMREEREFLQSDRCLFDIDIKVLRLINSEVIEFFAIF